MTCIPFIKWETVDEYNDYCLKGGGLTFEELKERGIVPIPLEYKEYHKFTTPSGKVELYSSLLEKHGYDPLPNYIEPPISEDGKIAKRYPLSLLQAGRVPSFTHNLDSQVRPCAMQIPILWFQLIQMMPRSGG